jgi:hypothetical protein
MIVGLLVELVFSALHSHEKIDTAMNELVGSSIESNVAEKEPAVLPLRNSEAVAWNNVSTPI